MQVAAFLLADHAEAVNGKLYVLGGSWNVIYAPGFPATHAHMSLATVLVVPWTATNERHTLSVELRDMDGDQLLQQKPEGEFEVGRPPGARAGDDAVIPIVFNFNQIKFEKAGWYSFVLSIDGVETARTRFRLQKTEAVASVA